jgi:hypothetical protein
MGKLKLLFVIVFVFVVSNGCSHANTTSVRMVAGASGANTTGEVQVSERDHGIVVVELTVDDLPSPQAVAANARSYVVWIEQDAGYPYRIGSLRSSGDRDAYLEAVSPFRTFQLYVTAESEPEAQRPSERRILTARVD